MFIFLVKNVGDKQITEMGKHNLTGNKKIDKKFPLFKNVLRLKRTLNN